MVEEGFWMESVQESVLSFHKPDIKEKIFFFISGLLVSVPLTLFFSEFSGMLCVALSPILADVCSIVILAPFIEELAKVFPLFYRHGETERSIMILAILTGLGFGITEFALYVFALRIPFIYRVPGVLFHASSAGITAYGIAKKKPLLFYSIAVLLHLVNNLFAVVEIPLLYLPGIAVLVGTFILAWRFYYRTSESLVVM